MPDTSPAPGSSSSSSSSSTGKSSGTFGFLTKKIGGVLPVWVIIAAIAGLWYWYYHYGPGAQASQAAQQQNQPGQVVNVRIVDDGGGRHTGPGPTPGPHPDPGGTKQITITRDMTFAQAIEYYHWDPETVTDIENMNSIQGQGKLTPATQLHKGETLIRPIDGGGDTNGSRWRTP